MDRDAVVLFYSEEDGGWIADLPALRSCSAFGDTPEEALAELEVAKVAWLEAAAAHGIPVPARFTTGSRA